MNSEIKKVLDRVKTAQSKLNSVLKKQDWVEDARSYAERQGRDVKKLLSSDVAKVKTFLERERKELERFQKQIPGEVKKLRSFLMAQRKDFERLIASVRKSAAKGAKSKTKSKSARPSGQKTTTKKKTTAKSAST